jgi:uncharacterized alpha-E superfamily protein
VHARSFRDDARQSIEAWLELEGPNLVAQESVMLSTTPAHLDGVLVPRPMSLRVFLARTPSGWEVMPGGFARIGRTGDPTAIAMQRGGSAADVWVVSEGPVPPESMLVATTGRQSRAEPGFLPARAADNLFWLGRYVERAEGAMRRLRAWHARLAESADPASPLLVHLEEHLGTLGIDPIEDRIGGVRRTLDQATTSAGAVRDRFSHDGWQALSDLAATAAKMQATARPGDDTARALSILLRKISGFSGLVHENMYRSIGWRFLEIGRALERAQAMALLLADLTGPEAPDGALELAIEIGDSVMIARRHYAVATNRETVLDQLALDASNPRAVLFQMAGMRAEIERLPDALAHGARSPLARAMLKAETDLAIETPETLTPATLRAAGDALGVLSNLLTESYLR